MAIPITIPRLGWNMEEGVFLGWLKQDGDPVSAGAVIFRLESEKAAEDIECHDAGILRIAPGGPAEGDTVPVGCVVGYLVQEGEEFQIADFRLQIEKPTTADFPPALAGKSESSEPKSASATPRARRVARELGVDWTQLHGSGRNGRIRERDVRAAGSGHRHELGRLRKASIEHLQKSRQAIPVTLTSTADVTSLVRQRQQWKTRAESAPSITDCFVRATALALRKHLLLAARWADDHLPSPSGRGVGGEGLILPDAIHMGIAVDTDAGLLVPVIRDAGSLSIEQIAACSRDLIARARSGTLTAQDMQGGVFTITNLGMFGIDAFTPVINYPQAAILGLGRIRRVPVFVGTKVEAREEITLSLTFDHRVVDGAPAARFLQALVQQVEKLIEPEA